MTTHHAPASCAPLSPAPFWSVVGVLAVLLPVIGLVLAASTGSALWLLPAAAVAVVVAVALTLWT